MADGDEAGQSATVLERMTSAGISEARALEHIARGAVRVEGEAVSDPAAAAPRPARWTIASV